MRWLKNIVSLMLFLAAVALAVGAAFSDHSDDFGSVPLPQGGIVHLPEGKVVVYYSQNGSKSDLAGQVNGPPSFQVASASTGVPVAISSAGAGGSSSSVQSSVTVGEFGAVANLDVPSEGEYAVSGSTSLPAGSSSLEFGTNAAAAVAARWRLLAGLIIGAILVSLIPVPRSKKRWGDDAGAPSDWSSSPRAPYAG